MRRVLINCDHCGDEINGDPFTIVKQDTHQLNRYYDGLNIDLCDKCASRIFERARTGLAVPDEPQNIVTESAKDVEPKKGGRKASFDTGKLLALANAGWAPKDIASELKITPKQVSAWLYNHKKREEQRYAEDE